MLNENFNTNSGISIWAYLLTGLKVFIISAVLGFIYYGIDWFVYLLFKVSMLPVIFVWQMSFNMIVIKLLVLIWLFISLYVGGFLCRKMWKWE